MNNVSEELHPLHPYLSNEVIDWLTQLGWQVGLGERPSWFFKECGKNARNFLELVCSPDFSSNVDADSLKTFRAQRLELIDALHMIEEALWKFFYRDFLPEIHFYLDQLTRELGYSAHSCICKELQEYCIKLQAIIVLSTGPLVESYKLEHT